MSNSSHCIGFSPCIDENCTHIILGSMPSIASLEARQYYAHPQNRFWPLMSRILENMPVPPERYADRLSMLLRHHIALWDSIGACDRDGSLDTAIKNEQGNDFTALLEKYPGIHTICFNGSKSFQCFKKSNKPLLSRKEIAFYPMPSTSPANARWKLDMLEDAWRIPLSGCIHHLSTAT